MKLYKTLCLSAYIKIAVILCLLISTGCTTRENDPVSTPSDPIHENPNSDVAVSTPESISSKEENKPYIESQLNNVDFSLFFDTIPAGGCSGDMTKEMCIELYGEKSAIPEGMELVENGEIGEYHYFTLNNHYDQSSVQFAVINQIFDSTMVRADFLLDENNHSKVILYFYYDQEIQQHPDYYDIAKSIENWGGTNIYHTAYFITQEEILTENNVVGRQGDYSLIKIENFYCDSVESELSKSGCEYIRNLKMVKFIE